MKYLSGWLKACTIGFEFLYNHFSISILWLTIFLAHDIYWRFNISLALPKYAFILTNSDKYFYKNQKYYFYKKPFGKRSGFYILHVIGVNAEEIEDKEDKWEN
jgi:hypothetical protein